jgi:hypothetical protein
VRKNLPAVFKGIHFQDEVILVCVRWYLRYSLRYRDLEEMMTERSFSVDHSAIASWVLHYAPLLHREFGTIFALRIAPGAWVKRMCAWLVDGPIYTEQSIPKATPSTLCFLHIGIGSPRSTSCSGLVACETSSAQSHQRRWSSPVSFGHC